MIRAVEKLTLPGLVTEWGAYYAKTNYSEAGRQDKERLVAAFLSEAAPKTTWDFGANDGRYSRLALRGGGSVTAFDVDPVAVERNYRAVKASGEDMLPLLLDLTNPSPGIGFANRERAALDARQRPDCIMLLAVVHHLAISNNLPLPALAEWLSGLTDTLILEFVPKEDSQVKTLLATREDIFPDYNIAGFEQAFSARFEIVHKAPIASTLRTLYLLRRKR